MNKELKDEFVPYEQALDLKELGFNEPCMFPYHRNNTDYIDSAHVELVNYNATEELVSAVLYQQAFRFFREKQGYFPDLFTGDDKTFGFSITYFTYRFGCTERIYYPIQKQFNTYEEAEFACLKKLIEIAKNK